MKQLFCAFFLLLAFSCKKNDEEKCTAGTGGTVTIIAHPKHHGQPVQPYNAYVKFNAREFPGTSPLLYDLDIAADRNLSYVRIPNLKCGDYYFYMVGYDTAIKEMALGGIPFSIAESATGEINIEVPVTE